MKLKAINFVYLKKLAMIGTHVAPAERSAIEQIVDEHSQVDSVEYAQQIMNAMPCLGLIVNNNRQIIYANEALMSLLGVEHMSKIIGFRPGELVACINSSVMPAGCGTAPACRHCGAVNTILKCQNTRKPVKSECRITSEIGGQRISFEFQVTGTPFVINNQYYTILTLTDISGEKRKQLLERTFLHDLTNKTSNLQGLAFLIKEADLNGKLKELTDILYTVSDTINDEIVSYKQLVNAETNSLSIKVKEVDVYDIIDITIKSCSYLDISRNKEIIPILPFPDAQLETDIVLLQRVLLNMMKNAIEATPEMGNISVGYTLEDGYVTYYVNNDGVILPHIREQIFQRSFSTKDPGRGIGTYSMKLLGERYLKGTVDFTSSIEEGTRFFIKLPLKWSKD
jgi:nitrogen-specific signal transduction histidine kinase